MRLYLDTSAAVKLVRSEAETPALRSWLSERADAQKVSSALVRVELVRSVRSFGPAAAGLAQIVLRSFELVELERSLLDEAASLGPAVLRTLDAIHLASALRVGPDLEAVVTYDRRMVDAAQALGLPVVHPGRP